MNKPEYAKYLTTLTIMPDYGHECLWIKRLTQPDSATALSGDPDLLLRQSISATLLDDLYQWQAIFEAGVADPCAGIILIDWPAYHQLGLQLARRLRAELPADTGVFYQKPYEDPNEQQGEIIELLHDGEKLLAGQRLRLRSGRQTPRWLPQCIIASGHTAVERAALDWAINERIPHAGWCGRWRQATYHLSADKYQLIKLRASNCRMLAEMNIKHSDATILFEHGMTTGTNSLIRELCERRHQLILVIDLNLTTTMNAAKAIRRWLINRNITCLHVAGPGRVTNRRLYHSVYAVLDVLIPRTRPAARA